MSQPKTIKEIVQAVLEAESKEAVCDAIDRDFLLGPWAHVLDPKVNTENDIRPGESERLCKDIRGLVWAFVKEIRGIDPRYEGQSLEKTEVLKWLEK
jgi:hypothetical protein